MNSQLLPQLFELVGKLPDHLWAEPSKRAEMQLELLRLQQTGEFKALESLLTGSGPASETEPPDTLADSLFKSGWRPYCGWVCGIGLNYQFLLRPLLNGLALGNFPSLEVDTLMTMLFGMLGLGAYRTIEKVKR